MSHSRWARALPFLAVLGSVTSLGIGTSLAKQHLFPQVGALGTTALRVGFSALLVVLMWRPWLRTLRKGDGWAVLRYGVALGFMNLLFYQSLQTIPFGVAVAIEFSGPLAVAMAGSRRAVDLVWLALAIIGLALLLPLGQGVDVAGLDPVGVGYALAAAACWGRRPAPPPARWTRTPPAPAAPVWPKACRCRPRPSGGRRSSSMCR